MGTRGARSGTGQRAPLTRDRILTAALELIDREGLEALSMRKLGAELGVEAMSLYNHVANKDDVLDGVVTLLWSEIASRTPTTGPWDEQARDFANAVRATAHAHPQAYPLVLTRGVLPPTVFRLGGKLQEALQEAGFADLAPAAMLALTSHAASQALAEVIWYGERASDEDDREASQWPPIVGAEEELPRFDLDAAFSFGLELQIQALAARLGY